MTKIIKTFGLFVCCALSPHFALATIMVTDFQTPLQNGFDPNGQIVGYIDFAGGGSSISSSVVNDDGLTVPSRTGNAANGLLSSVGTSSSFAGIVELFANPSVDEWITQDWSGKDQLSFWMYGSNTGNQLFFDIINNRNPGSTTDDAERFFTEFVDDFSGWQLMNLSFADFMRKDIGNGAPDDGLDLSTMRGWAIGVSGNVGDFSITIDDITATRAAAVPVPATMALLLIGFAGFVVRKNRPNN